MQQRRGGGGGGGIPEKRYDAHPPSWLVVSAGQQKRIHKLGDFFADEEFRSFFAGASWQRARKCTR